MACEADRYVQVITSGEEPFQIVWASEAWLQLCEYAMGQVLGHTLELIQGPLTTRTSLGQLMGAIRGGEPISLSMVNHTRTGKAFSHKLRVEPLRDSRGNVQCFQATSSNIEFISPSIQASMQGGAAPSATGPTDPTDQTDTSLEMPADLGGDTLPPLPTVDDNRRFDSPIASPQLKSMKRTGSELKISEMLDLFDTSRAEGAVSSMSAGQEERDWS